MDGYEVFLLYASRPPAGAGQLLPLPRELLDAALRQTRDWPEAAAIARAATGAIKIHDPLPSPERLAPFCTRVAETVARGRVTAILWAPAERLLAPDRFAAALRDEDFFSIAVNLRLFHVEDGPAGETVMDTIGLAPLGLPDTQCHFISVDRDVVAALLLELARYVADEGELISEGDTVPGARGDKWICHLEESLLEPLREVIDVEPPRPHSLRRSTKTKTKK